MSLYKFKMLATLLCFPFIFATQTSASAAERMTLEDLAAAKRELDRESNARAIAKAFHDCLHDPELAAIITSAFETQIYSNRPLAFVNGYWAKPINLSAIYADRDINLVLQQLLSDNPSALQALADAVAAVEDGQIIDPAVGAGLVFIPHDVAADEAMTDLIGLTESIAGGAFLDDLQGIREMGANDFIVGLIIGVGASLIAGAILDSCEDDPTDPHADIDGDGKENWIDGDDDGDGTADHEDGYQYDDEQSITHCPPPGLCFSTNGLVGSSAEAVMDVTTQTWVDVMETQDIMSIEPRSGVGMLLAFPGL